MTLATKIGVLGVAVLWFTMPTLACLAPTASLTDTERECCQSLADQCGNSAVPSSHTCCEQLAGRDVSNFVLAVSQCTPGDLFIAAIEHASASVQAAVPTTTRHVHWLDELRRPPESPPAFSSILRI